jgi:hypothetical protein
MMRFLHEMLGYFARRLILGLIDDAVEWIRATLRKWLAHERAALDVATLPAARSAAAFDADVVERIPAAVSSVGLK